METKYTVKVNEYGTFWYKGGTKILHRLDGPACELADGSKDWLVDGKRHRTDGPAVELADGSKFWFIKDKQLSEKEFNKRTKPKTCTLISNTVIIDGQEFILVPKN